MSHHVRPEDLMPPEWARISAQPSVAPDDDATPTFGPNTLDTDSAFTPQPQAAPPSGRRKKAKRAKPEPSPRAAKTSQYAGGRWKVKLLRGLVFTVLGVLCAGGLKNVITNEPAPTAAELAALVQTELGLTGYPTDSAEAFAVRFAREYLTYDATNPDDDEARAARLAIYSPAAAEGAWGWDGTGKQALLTGPYVSAPTQVDGKNFATITVAAQVTGGAWLSLAIPVYADTKSGALTISGPPAFVAAPALATSPGKEAALEVDDELSQTLATDLFPGFLAAWADSNQTELDRYVTTDATTSARTGLARTVTFESLDDLVINLGGERRTGQATVTWSTSAAGAFSQTYKVTIARGPDGRWSVADISGGVVSPPEASTATGTETAPTDPTATETADPVQVP